MDASNLLDEISLVLTDVSEVILFVACNAGTLKHFAEVAELNYKVYIQTVIMMIWLMRQVLPLNPLQ